MRIEVPPAVRKMVRRLEAEGFETWAVGGGVRDAVRGSPGEREDWDLATRAHPQQVRSLFRRTVPLGIEYGTVGVFGSDGVLYEVTTFRHDVITYGRKAVVAFAETLREDLARRDFTVNAMAWHPEDGVLYDPYGGQEDLAQGILRAVGAPAERFREDYLRVLRGLRFAGTLGFAIEPDTWGAMVEAVPGLTRLSVERVREELMKVLTGPRPSRSLRLYRRCGALHRILPEIEGSLTDDALGAVDAVPRHEPDTRMAMLLLQGLGAAAASAGPRVLARLRFSNSEVQRIGAACRGGLGPPKRLVRDAPARRRWAARMGRRALGDIFGIWRAAAGSRADRDTSVDPTVTGVDPTDTGVDPAGVEVERAIAAIESDLGAGIPLSTRELAVAGGDLVALGWQPGPEIGKALGRLLEAVWEDPATNERSTLLEMAANMDPAGEPDG